MSEDQIRQDFEEWFSEGGLSQRALERNSVGNYRLMQAASAWEVWKAAHAHYAKPAAPAEDGELLATGGQPQADALDAERYRFIKRKLSLIGNGDGTCSMQAVNLPARVLGWPDVGDEARLQFLDDAIDAAIAAAKENT